MKILLSAIAVATALSGAALAQGVSPTHPGMRIMHHSADFAPPPPGMEHRVPMGVSGSMPHRPPMMKEGRGPMKGGRPPMGVSGSMPMHPPRGQMHGSMHGKPPVEAPQQSN